VSSGTNNSSNENELRDVTRGYYAMISEVDHHVGLILQKLEELHLTDNTIVVFSSDHGEWLGEHMRYHKGFWAPDAVSRVPLIIKVPNMLSGAKRRIIDEIVECVDVTPTLLNLSGIQIPPDIQGYVLPVTEKDNSYRCDGIGLTEHHGWKSMRFKGFRYVVDMHGNEMLFDLADDPNEYNNVSGNEKYFSVLARARHMLISRMIRIERVLKIEWPY